MKGTFFMNEKEILAMLMSNPEIKELFTKLLLKEEAAKKAHETGDMFVWCAEMRDNVTGTLYYHPIVIPNNVLPNDLDALLLPSSYKMAAYENQFEAYEMQNALMTLNAYGTKMVLIMINASVYKTLENQLTALMTQIIGEIEKCFEPIDRIADLTNARNSQILKLQLLASVVSKITTTSYCFDQNMTVHDSKSHNYTIEEPDYGHFESDEDEYYDDECDDDEDCECKRRNNCPFDCCNCNNFDCDFNTTDKE